MYSSNDYGRSCIFILSYYDHRVSLRKHLVSELPKFPFIFSLHFLLIDTTKQMFPQLDNIGYHGHSSWQKVLLKKMSLPNKLGTRNIGVIL